MRRSFNKKILPMKAPPKNAREYKRKEHYKTKQKRCTELEILMQDYKAQAIEYYNLYDLAKACGVNPNTVRRWFYGFPMSHLVYWNVARYFEQYLPISAEVIKHDIESTIREFKEGK